MKWDKKGVCSEQELLDLVSQYEYTYYLAFQTNLFLSGSSKMPSLKRIEWNKLLEIRLFSKKSELLARRTMIGRNHLFQWRIASEKGLREDEYFETYQTLDIDSSHTTQGEHGNLNLITTGGGTYELPIDKSITCVKLISYIDYKQDEGMAYIYDDRFVDFLPGGEA